MKRRTYHGLFEATGTSETNSSLVGDGSTVDDQLRRLRPYQQC